MKVDELPNFIICSECDQRHFLTLNRDAFGGWSIAYVDYQETGAIPGLALNGSDSIDEAAVRMEHAIARYNKRRSHGSPTA